ncbi:MAG TPA: helix-turn-helix transcriptional regulator [Gemmatimonadaceae bacterium]|nr:helix-turn-helix transcriptional regulator [Gemmatimonadaceae bacterium]
MIPRSWRDAKALAAKHPERRPVTSQEDAQNVRVLFREYRRRLGISQEALALAAEVDRTYIGKIEARMLMPGFIRMDRLLTVLGVSWAEFIADLHERRANAALSVTRSASRKGSSGRVVLSAVEPATRRNAGSS